MTAKNRDRTSSLLLALAHTHKFLPAPQLQPHLLQRRRRNALAGRGVGEDLLDEGADAHVDAADLGLLISLWSF